MISETVLGVFVWAEVSMAPSALLHVYPGTQCFPIPGNIQGQVEWGSEQPVLIEDVPAHSRGIGLDDL